ncbi:MAG: tRNA pseudouridine(55) synthase TruB [Pontibacterium sp.]
MGNRRAKGRAIDGIFILDKPQGLSSNAALQRVKRAYGAQKAGHTGALDPLATGLLPVCLGEATKFSQYLLDADKRYQTTAKLGVRTDSSDADGEVVETKPVPSDLTREQVEALVAEHFTGEIEQVPSMFSALKFNGQPLYKLARQGIKVEVKPRQVTIYDIKVTDFRGDEIDLDVHCSKGTYIRSIVEDLGLLIGCGAHVSMLRRTQAGPFKASQMRTLDELAQLAQTSDENTDQESIQAQLDEVLLPPWVALEDAVALQLGEAHVKALGFGRAFTPDEPPAVTEEMPYILLFDAATERFLGIGELDEEGQVKPKRLVATN